MASFSARTGLTGMPPLAWITPIFALNVGGAGGGARRVTTARLSSGRGGRTAGPPSTLAVIRTEAGTGRNGSGPLTTGASIA